MKEGGEGGIGGGGEEFRGDSFYESGEGFWRAWSIGQREEFWEWH
jgi:hypothetical protein